MLIQFTVENHRSIKNSAVISFAASKDKSFEEYLLHPDEKKSLLPVLAIYGANAAGKSNVLHAMMTMKEMVVGSAAKVSKGQELPFEPFGGTTGPTSFEMVFIFQGVRYSYGFSFDAKKIYKEYLYHWPNGREALIFSRDNGVYEFRENVNEQVTLSNRTSENKLYLVSSNDWNLPQTEKAYRWFREKLTFLMDEEPDKSETVARILQGEDKKARVLKELMLADLGITDVTIKNSTGNVPLITATHRIINKDGTTEYFLLPMEMESAGTQRFFARIGGWLHSLENGALLVVDEIEDSLHPLLTRRLIEMVQDKTINTNGAQLIFTTHDAMLLDLNFFRRDQIWFAEKNDKTCATELYPLSSFSPKKERMFVRDIFRDALVQFLLSEGRVKSKTRKEYDPNNVKRRKRKPIVYIICEGKETEPLYFKHFRTRNCLVDIIPIPSKHKAAEHLVKHAKSLISQLDFYPKDGDQLWCVFDCDDNKDYELQSAFFYAEKHGYKIVYSNPSFEYWYLLHFEKWSGYLKDSSAVIEILKTKGYLENYRKNVDVFDKLQRNQSVAIQGAKERVEQVMRGKETVLCRDSNPVTTVYELVEYLNSERA